MLAVLKAGGAFVPLDPSHPVERLRSLCKSVRATLILCSTHLVQRVGDILETVLPVDDAVTSMPDRMGHKDKGPSIPSMSSSNVAYVIFTSGSTGMPKVRSLSPVIPT